MRKAHRLQTNTRSRGHPRYLLCFDTETAGQPTPENPSVIARLKFGFAIWKETQRGTRHTLDFETTDEFWDFVEKHSRRHEILWLVGLNAKNFDYAVLEYEAQLSRRGWSFCANPILPTDGQGPLKITCKKERRKLCLCDLGNWYGPQSLERIGKSIGLPKFEAEEAQKLILAEKGSSLWERLKEYCRRDTEIVLRAMETWIEFLKLHDLGNFAISLAGQALAAFRHRFMQHEIFIHDNPAALALERKAYNGARVDCFRVGEFKGSFHVVDVNSEYPFVMRTERYPIKLLSVDQTPTLRKLRRLLYDEDRAVVASVSVNTDLLPLSQPSNAAIVPTVHDGKLIYPLGRFQTTLCTGELKLALEAGIIESVESMAIYEQAPIFIEYVDFFYGLRRQYQEAQNDAYDTLAKLFMNALYGKWGQLNYQWTDLPGRWLERAGLVSVMNTKTGETTVLRQLGDLCQQRSQERQEGTHSFCAIAAHATSYARLCIGSYRAQAGLRHAYYTDTDSLIVDDEGLRRLQPQIGPELGQLKLEESASSMRITAPKNYQCGSKVRHKGRRKDAEALGGGHYRQLQFRGLAGAMRALDPNHALLSLVVKRADVPYSKGVVGADGWTSPLRL